ncbi:hypothetical protein ACGFJ7_16300 [Actinoplanes sp. NPDC048988]|uniref:hypothetical protein n=1 Tax=Actinoplanes sp. NPDC048988 TaxID=3363901 RepID=UPI003713769F
MIDKVKLAIVGVGNNTSALVQGINFYRNTGSLVGIRRADIGGLGVGDLEVVAAFALDLIRLAAIARREHRGGYLSEAAEHLKSPPGTAV